MSSPLEIIRVIRRKADAAIVSSDLNQDREYCREFLQTLVRSIVDYPETVSVEFTVGDRTTVYKVQCQQKCLGQIIGSKGKNISGIRAVVGAMMARKGIRAIVEIPYFAIAAD